MAWKYENSKFTKINSFIPEEDQNYVCTGRKGSYILNDYYSLGENTFGHVYKTRDKNKPKYLIFEGPGKTREEIYLDKSRDIYKCCRELLENQHPLDSR